MWNRLKSAWLVLTGRAYAIAYATVYENVMIKMGESGATKIKMSQLCDPKKW